MDRKVISLVTNITIIGAFLYLIAWIYWKSYFESLGFDASFVDMSIEKTLTSKWSNLLMLLLMFLSTISVLVSAEKIKNHRYVLFFILFTIVFVLSLYLFKSVFAILAVLIIVTTLIAFSLYKWGHKIGAPYQEKILKNAKAKMLYVIVLTSIFMMSYKGREDAVNLYKNYVEDAEFYFRKEVKNQKVKFVSIINDRYFVLKKENGTIIPIVYEAQEISKIYFGN